MLPNETEEIEAYVDSISSRKLSILRRGDGFFTFSEEHYKTFQHHSLNETYSYWSPVAGGGLFQTIDDAKREAFASTPWLKEQSDKKAEI